MAQLRSEKEHMICYYSAAKEAKNTLDEKETPTKLKKPQLLALLMMSMTPWKVPKAGAKKHEFVASLREVQASSEFMSRMPDSTPSPLADGDGDVDMDAGIGPTALDFEGGDAGDDMEP